MPVSDLNAPVTVPAIRARKGRRKLVSVTAYDAPTGALLDEAGVDIILVGDSLGNVVLGYDSTLPVTMPEMRHHVRAVCRGVKRALVVADMPFLSYQAGTKDAIRNAGQFLKDGAAAVKLEGGQEILGTVEALISCGIPVMGHVGLTPQRIREYGRYRVQGKEAGSAYRIWRAARALDRLGVFAVVLESVPAALAKLITAACGCPTIGIGAGRNCDGQIMVFHDLVGLTPSPPGFARSFARGREIFGGAVKTYLRDVRRGRFPKPGGSPDLSSSNLRELQHLIGSLSEKS